MKAQNFAVKFKNSFALSENDKVTPQQPILKDTLSSVTSTQLSSLIQLYTRDTFQNGFNPVLAFRVIILYCYSSDQENKLGNFQLKTQLNRYLKHHLNQTRLQNIQQCLDLLIIDQVRRKLPSKHYKLFKIRVLSCLNKYYLLTRSPAERKKSTFTLRQLCKQALKDEKIKHDQDVYCQILDILLQLQTRECQIKLKKKKKFEAVQLVNNMIRYLENTQFALTNLKYQQSLMESYWTCARLHYDLHYIAYTKKYCLIVINIAQRLNNTQQSNQIKIEAQQLLEKVML